MATVTRSRRRKVDPKRILEQIASDPEVSAYARVAAARALLTMADAEAREPTPEARAARVSERALRVLNGGRRD
jgi:hypothetical protein